MKYLLVAALPLWLLACNSIKDIQPPDPDGVPVTAVQAIKNSYPQATNILFTTLTKNQLWRANFTQRSINYQTQVNATAIVSAVYKELAPDFAPFKNLTDKLAIQGGSFSKLQGIDNDTSQTRLMQYTFNGATYQLIYQPGVNNQALLTLTPLPVYTITDLNQLPQRTQNFFANHTSSLRFVSGNVIQQTPNKITYWLEASLVDGQTTVSRKVQLFFDTEGNLSWIEANANGNPIGYTNNEQVGDASLLAALRADYPSFDASPTMAFETYFDGLVSVRYALQRVTPTTTETWDIGLQWPSGQRVYTRFQAQYKP
ncbi:hypothetical protein M0L20_17065 [Spirosoma sp. RP8]|uniref:DUF4292 domain-containing protein n=1 Tax=Spirosoma liriopis TaxID=2937440 RepID=A0ABT0HN33_9BACT|nr:hypothetical protein [Spirosoma liriopis]MCK8493579.1 hypothetical protein [Spirosoma liriopis]